MAEIHRTVAFVRPSSAVQPRSPGISLASGSRATLWIAGAGALAYSSWPLAFLVNQPLAGSGLASSFEGRSQPYDWLFILLDCIAGLCIGIVCIRELRPSLWRPRPSNVVVVGMLAYGVFGLATAIDAVVPLSCGSTSAQACASQLWPPTPDDVLTGTAIFALFVAAAMVVVQMIKARATIPTRMPITVVLALVGWSALGLIVLLWSTSAAVAASSQYAFLSLTSVLLFIVPLGFSSAW